MRKIAKCLPASEFDLCEKVRKEGIRNRGTVRNRLGDLIDLGFVKKSRCRTCNHKVFELFSSQTLISTREDGSRLEERFCLIKNNELDEFNFNLTLFGKIQCTMKERKQGKKVKTTKKNLTIRSAKTHPNSSLN